MSTVPLYRVLGDIYFNISNVLARDVQPDSGRKLLESCDAALDDLENLLPSGSGIDTGTKLRRAYNDLEEEGMRWHRVRLLRPRFTMQADFHHMNENGYYDGWTYHSVVVTPAWDGISLRFTGLDRNDIKDYLHEVFHYTLSLPMKYDNNHPTKWVRAPEADPK